jgi:hypothetical protein
MSGRAFCSCESMTIVRPPLLCHLRNLYDILGVHLAISGKNKKSKDASAPIDRCHTSLIGSQLGLILATSPISDSGLTLSQSKVNDLEPSLA